MGIGSWLKNWRKREDAEAVKRAGDKFFDTPLEERAEAGQLHFETGWLPRTPEPDESADPEERLAEDEER